jgi:hypothetical protein
VNFSFLLTFQFKAPLLLREVTRDVLGILSHAVEAVLAVHLCQVHMSVLTKEADSVQDSPTSINILMKCYLFGMKRKGQETHRSYN